MFNKLPERETICEKITTYNMFYELNVIANVCTYVLLDGRTTDHFTESKFN